MLTIRKYKSDSLKPDAGKIARTEDARAEKLRIEEKTATPVTRNPRSVPSSGRPIYISSPSIDYPY